jgi:hypothetical protein
MSTLVGKTKGKCKENNHAIAPNIKIVDENL